ncbi:MAG: leucyl aminopeptidase family protein [Hymenobacteraceae bacterium]|nr:leucyl aminopeptidase family protein [Hymenobacteraceae bacterium]
MRYGHGCLYIVTVPTKPAIPELIREAVRKLGHQLHGLLTTDHVAALHILPDDAVIPSHALALTEGVALSTYTFAPFKTKPADPVLVPLAELTVVGADEDAAQWLVAVLDGVFLARDLVNTPFSHQSAVQLADQFTEAGQKAGFTVEVLDQPRIQTLKMGGLLAVNQGSLDPPTFSILEYAPAGTEQDPPVVLVGKGVVFDTGGLSLKPTPNSMDMMKCDMAGGAAVAGTLAALALAQVRIRVVGLVPATDNRPGEAAFAPGDVLKMHDGQTVEITNTDAEGRLILADALSFAKRYNPALVIDIATLTGSAANAVGKEGLVLIGTAPDAVKEELKAAGAAVHERLVEFPLWEEYKEQLKSDLADLKHYQPGAQAGHVSAAAFLEAFTAYPWLHLDIAGPAFLTAADSYRGKGGTGTAVRLLAEFLKTRAEPLI